MFKRITEFSSKIGLLDQDRFLISFSGGADSRLLLEWAQSVKSQSELVVVYFDHGLRDTQADHNLIRNIDLQIDTIHLEVQKVAKNEKISIEMAGRKLRYQHLLQLAKKYQVHAVLTGHHSNDRVETSIQRLISGTFNGASSIQSVVSLEPPTYVYRPLLELSKLDILNELKFRKLNWIEDPTNQHRDYSRNQIRNDLLPMMKIINPNVETAILRFCESFDELNEFLNSQYKKVVRLKGGRLCIDLKSINNLDPFVIKGILRIFCNQTELNPREITKLHIQQIFKVATRQIQRTQLPQFRVTKIRNHCLFIEDFVQTNSKSKGPNR